MHSSMGGVLLYGVQGYHEVIAGPLAGCTDGEQVQRRDRELTIGLR